MTPIVIFGAAVRPGGVPSGTLRRRVEAALALGRTLEDALYVPTGGQGAHGPPEALVMRRLLMEAGVDAAAIRVEPTGRNTIRSACACARLLRPDLAHRPVYVATSAYHMPRCVLLLRLCGLRARPGRAPAQPASARWTRRWYWRLREVPAVPLDAALLAFWRIRGRFGARAAQLRLIGRGIRRMRRR